MRDNVEKIVQILDIVLNSFNITDMNKIKEVHQNGWKEFLNGNKNSQLEATKNQTAKLTEIIEALPDNVIEMITNAINK